MKKLKKTLRQWIAVTTAVCTVFSAYLSVGSISANASETTNASETKLSNFSLSDFSNWKREFTKMVVDLTHGVHFYQLKNS